MQTRLRLKQARALIRLALRSSAHSQGLGVKNSETKFKRIGYRLIFIKFDMSYEPKVQSGFWYVRSMEKLAK